MKIKPGILAFIVGGYPENIGKVVTVGTLWPNIGPGRNWSITSEGSLLKVQSLGRVFFSKDGLAQETSLRAIDPPPLDADITSKELERV